MKVRMFAALLLPPTLREVWFVLVLVSLTSLVAAHALWFAPCLVNEPKLCNLSKTPMGDELKWLHKEGGGCIFESCDILPTSHAVIWT